MVKSAMIKASRLWKLDAEDASTNHYSSLFIGEIPRNTPRPCKPSQSFVIEITFITGHQREYYTCKV